MIDSLAEHVPEPVRTNTRARFKAGRDWPLDTENPSVVARNGIGAMYGTKNPTTISSTSPAKIFPNRRKVKEMTFENSLMSSRRPTKVPMG